MSAAMMPDQVQFQWKRESAAVSGPGSAKGGAQPVKGKVGTAGVIARVLIGHLHRRVCLPVARRMTERHPAGLTAHDRVYVSGTIVSTMIRWNAWNSSRAGACPVFSKV